MSRALLGLALAPLVTLIAAAIAPRLNLSEGAADAIVFAGGATTGFVAIAVAARAALAPRAAIAIAACGALLAIAARIAAPPPAIAAALVNLGLVAIAHAAGGSIGRRVSHPGHLLPACVVAAAADVASVIHPAGPSHAIERSERALSLVTIGFPIPGSHDVAPALGVGDLIFLALVFGVAVAHVFSIGRTAACAAIGLAAAGALAAWLRAGVPALVPIGAAIVAGVPEARRVRREDRRVAAIAAAIACAVVAGVLLTPSK